MVTVETINGTAKVGDAVAYASSKGNVRGTIKKIVQTSEEGWGARPTITTLRVHVKRTNNSSWHPVVIIRRPASLVRIFES